MKLSDQVVSLDLAKQLKELGVQQDSLFYWMEYRDEYAIPIKTEPHVIYGKMGWKDGFAISAFTATELGEMLPVFYESYRSHGEQGGPWYSKFFLGKTVQMADTEANARAKMLIYLIENKLLVQQEGR